MRSENENGSVILLTLLGILPALLMMFYLSIDLGTFFDEFNEQQRTEELNSQMYSKFLTNEENLEIRKTFTQEANFSPIFDLSNTLNPKNSIALKYKTLSKTEFKPINAAIIVDISNYLAPKLNSGISIEEWGELSELNPASYFLENKFEDNQPLKTQEIILNNLNYTQRCFNPYFNIVKNNSLIISDIILQNYNNRLNVYFSGVNKNGFVSKLSDRVKVFESQEYRSAISSSSICTLASNKEKIYTDLYEVPKYENSRFFSSIKYNPEINFNETNFYNKLDVRQLIWSHPVTEELRGVSNKLIQDAAYRLLFSEVPAKTKDGTVFKPWLSQHSKYYLFLVTGSFPDEFNGGNAEFVTSKLKVAIENIAKAYSEKSKLLNMYIFYHSYPNNKDSNVKLVSSSEIQKVMQVLRTERENSKGIKLNLIDLKEYKKSKREIKKLLENIVSEPLIVE